MDLQRKAPCKSFTGTELYPNSGAVAFSYIINGLCEGIQNVHNYRLFMREKIKDIMKKQEFAIDRKAMLDSWMPTREEE